MTRARATLGGCMEVSTRPLRWISSCNLAVASLYGMVSPPRRRWRRLLHGGRRQVQPVQVDGVLAGDLQLVRLGQALRLGVVQLRRVGPGADAVREVAGPEELVMAEVGCGEAAGAVVLEG